MGHVWRLVKETVIILLGALVVSALLQHFVAQMFVIPSGSMKDTLRVGDRVVAEKIGNVERGEIAVFKDSGDWLGPAPMVDRGAVGTVLETIGVLPDTSENYLIKRVIGMPGDEVACCDADGRLTVNDVPLHEEEYLFVDSAGQQVAPSDVEFRVKVPADRMFMMGDNRNASADSRCHLDEQRPQEYPGESAFVPIDDVAGVGWAYFAPFTRAGLLPVPDTFDTVPDAIEPAAQDAEIELNGPTC